MITLTGPSSSSATGLETFGVIATGTEDIPVFASGTLDVTNGDLVGQGTRDPDDMKIWRLSIRPNGMGNIAIVAPAGTFDDASGNPNTAPSNTLDVTYIPPTPLTIESFTGPEGERVLTLDEFDVVVTFSEAVRLLGIAVSFDINNGEIILVKGNLTDTLTVTIKPDGVGDIELTIPVNGVTNLGGTFSNEAPGVHTVTYVAPPTPLTIESFTGPEGERVLNLDEFDVVVTFSEPVNAVTTVSFNVVNGRAIRVTGNTTDTITVIIEPDGVGDIKIDVPADQAINLTSTATNTASGVYTVFFGPAPITDTGALPFPPPLTGIAGPQSVGTLEEFDVTWTFSEDVTLDREDDFEVTNGSVTGFAIGSSTGTSLSSKASLSYTTNLSSKVFRLTITPDGSGRSIEYALVAGRFIDSENMFNRRIARTVLVSPDTDTDTAATKAAITDFMLNRSSQLASNQPGLTHILQGDSATLSGAANGTDSSGKVVGRMSHTHGGTGTWGEINSAWSDEDSNDSSYTLVSVGGHGYVQPNTIVGGMIQLDLADDDALNITGKGWLSGPYFVHKLNEQNVYFEGRLLYGQTENEISPSNAYTDSFDSDRYLAQFRITGEYGYQTATIMPLLDFTYTEDTQQAYTDSLRRLIEEQSVDLTQMTFGIDFKLPIAMQRGSLDFTGGLSGIYSQVNGGNGGKSESNIKGGRGRMELGINYRRSENGNGNRVTLIATTFYDGISSDYESYGVNFSVGLEF